jgi:hypothetical protein
MKLFKVFFFFLMECKKIYSENQEKYYTIEAFQSLLLAFLSKKKRLLLAYPCKKFTSAQ